MNRRMFLRRMRGGASASTTPTPAPSPTPTPSPAPVNTALPTITNATIGVPMQVLDYGTWDNGPIANYLVDWRVDGASQGSSYTPVEADRTKSITAQVTAQNAFGDTAAVSAGKTCRRTEPTVDYNFGKLTPNRSGSAHFGKARIAYLMVSAGRPLLGTGVAEPSTWTVGAATSGTDAHWDRTTGDGWTPCKAGAINGDYVFTMTADFGSFTETQTLTIHAKDNVVTRGSDDGVDFGNAATNTAADVSGGIIEFAMGCDWSAAPGCLLRRKVFTNTVTFQHAHPERLHNREKFGALQVLGIENAIFESIRTYNHPFINGGRFYFKEDGNFTSSPPQNITINDYQHIGDEASMLTNGGSSGSAWGCLVFVWANNVTVNDPHLAWFGTGISLQKTTNVVVNRHVLEYFFNNAIEYGSAGLTNFTMYDGLVMRPWYGGVAYEALHLDAAQQNDATSGGTANFIRCMHVRAGGNRSTQTFFAPAQGTVGGTANNIRGYISSMRGGHALTVGKMDNSIVEHFAVFKHDGQDFAATTGASGSGEYPAISLGTTPPLGTFGHATDSGYTIGSSVVRKGFIEGTLGVNAAAAGNVTLAADAYQFTRALDYDGNPKTSNPSLTAQLIGGDPRAAQEAITDEEWRAMSPAQVKAFYFALCRAQPGSNLEAVTPVNAAGTNWRDDLLAL